MKKDWLRQLYERYVQRYRQRPPETEPPDDGVS